MDLYDDDFVALIECHCCPWSGYEDEVTIDGRCPECGTRFGVAVARGE